MDQVFFIGSSGIQQSWVGNQQIQGAELQRVSYFVHQVFLRRRRNLQNLLQWPVQPAFI